MMSESGTEPGAAIPRSPETAETTETPDLRDRAAASIRDLLRQRNGKTICPSETARAIGGDDWRDLMPLVRDVAAGLVDQGQVIGQQKGETVDIAAARGPIRLAPGPTLNGTTSND
ncbi:DUF3253 domain-containing protein [Kocuria carniphila]|uniref:DUF3253 domain-containing protein n=1 Tax=Kocuria carniphila TaxID=262208 RepID=UPI00101CD594|nr:DUF3253 domain-containing protein [Kocuria carniphila]